jgi:hypothetical protein
MRINRKTLTLIVASLCGAGSTAMGQEDSGFIPRSNVGRIGDSGSPNDAVPTAPRGLTDLVASPSDLEQIANPGWAANPNSSSGSLSDAGRFEGERPVAAYQYHNPQAAPLTSSAAESSGSNYSSYNSCPPASQSLARSGPSGLGWADFDTLLWWGRGLTNSPVIVGGNSPTVIPTVPLLGGANNPIGNEMTVGLRANLGFWLDDCQNYGIGGRVWGLLSNGTEHVFPAGGNSTGIAFFNTSLNQPDVYLVNLDRGIFGANTGTISVLSDLDVVSTDIYGRARLIGDRNNRTDLIGGYTFLRLDSMYQLKSSILDGWTDAPPPVGTVTSITDTFATKNEFNGGNIGLLTNTSRGRVGFSFLGKVALGNMSSTSIISGNYNQVPPPPSAPDVQNRGLFAQSSNIGTLSRNQFTFIPEVNARLMYQIGRAQLGVGYSIIVLPEVAMGASQVNTNVDALGIISPPIVAPTPKFNTEAYVLQGLDLGVTFNF